DYSVDVQGGSEPQDLGPIALTGLAQMLEEVVVTGRIPIVIKGDTTEYDAGSFTVEKNAKVEDLLKVLPGITVDASGKITAQGKTVEKVLVDGEEFFGDDRYSLHAISVRIWSIRCRCTRKNLIKQSELAWMMDNALKQSTSN